MVSRFPAAEEFVSLRDAMDRLLSDSFVGGPFRSFWSPAANGASRMPLPLDVYATGDEVFLIAAVPGLSPDDIEITINQGTVTLSGKTPNVAQSEEAKNATWYLHELPHGAFTRSVTLPIEVDASKADATFEQGILRLRLPKAEQAKPKQIKVRIAGTSETEAIESGTK
jgi:HSP20 family protein